MDGTTNLLKRLRKDCSAVTALEYGLIAALIAAAMMVAVTQVGTNVAAMFTNVAGSI